MSDLNLQPSTALLPPRLLATLRCPETGEALAEVDGALVNASGTRRYAISPSGIPLFAEHFLSDAGRIQQAHYDRVAADYIANLSYPHTLEYTRYLDDAFKRELPAARLGTIAELCCGRGEAVRLLEGRFDHAVGVDISRSMLETAAAELQGRDIDFVQGDATRLPLLDASFDAVFMFGGIHHVNDREGLFAEVARILRSGGRFYFREPVSDFWPWRAIRAVIYRFSPALDHDTERPLLWQETVPVLERHHLRATTWKTYGFLGFCFFMNSDVLVFNRLFRFVPGIRALTRLAARIDAWTVRLPGLRRAGLQVVGVAQKP
ncbi:MAG TPA: class I SAM-dependent methyltransferase [Lysobacter sp.]|jgi:SAM-dependent methyltransferase|nr:class I SAM-dependent methyltransferase [Lysobacter sp.]